MAGGRFMTTFTPKYVKFRKSVAPFGTTLDCAIWRGALGTRQMEQSRIYAERLRLSAFPLIEATNSIDAQTSKINSHSIPNGHAKPPFS